VSPVATILIAMLTASRPIEMLLLAHIWPTKMEKNQYIRINYSNFCNPTHAFGSPLVQMTVPAPPLSGLPFGPISGMTHLISSAYGQGHIAGMSTQSNVVGQRYLLHATMGQNH
jgi:hypothetical protein